MYPPNESAAFLASKEAILNLLRTRGCADVGYISSRATSFLDLVSILVEFAKTFDCDTDYLASILTLINDSVLVSRGIYVGKTLSSVTNPYIIVGGTITNVNITGNTTLRKFPGLNIFNNANISTILISGNILVDILVISSGSHVEQLEVQSGSCIDSLILKACNSKNGQLDKLIMNSCVNNFASDEDSVFGGEFCKPQTLT